MYIHTHIFKYIHTYIFIQTYIYLGLVSLFLMAYQLFVGYLLPNPFSTKNNSGTI